MSPPNDTKSGGNPDKISNASSYVDQPGAIKSSKRTVVQNNNVLERMDKSSHGIYKSQTKSSFRCFSCGSI